jgi:hypothetical protein
MPKFLFAELVDAQKQEVITTRLGAGSGAANNLTDAENGKLVKLAGESRYNLCAVGDEIEGRIVAINVATQDAFTLGSVQKNARFAVTFDGLQATPGTGAVAVGDYVVCGTPVVKGTSLPLIGSPKVCKATAAGNTLNHKWRVISLGTAGTGAAGTTGLIELVS